MKVLQVLDSWGVYATRSAYMPEVCRHILWAVLHEWWQFFDNKLLSTPFRPGKTVVYPVCLLIILDIVLNAEPIACSTYPLHGAQKLSKAARSSPGNRQASLRHCHGPHNQACLGVSLCLLDAKPAANNNHNPWTGVTHRLSPSWTRTWHFTTKELTSTRSWPHQTNITKICQ
jgi:hypothetical protein